MKAQPSGSLAVAALWIVAVLATFSFLALGFLAALTLWVGYVNRTLPGSWLPLLMAIIAMPLLSHAWFATIRALFRQARKTDLLAE